MGTVLPLPKETAALLRRHEPGDHLGLWIDRFLQRDDRDLSLKGEVRLGQINRFVGRHEAPLAGAALARRVEGDHLTVLPHPRDEAAWEAHHQQPPSPRSLVLCRITAQTIGRLVVDYGRTTAQEFSLSFHHVLGVPQIPGSAIKGLIRQVIDREEGQPAPDVLGQGPDRKGNGARAGSVECLDALPVGGFELAPDIINPHYGPWYRGKEPVVPPADWLTPVPTTLLCVVNTTFAFDLLARAADLESLHHAAAALVCGLEVIGLGARRGSGYGYFEVR